MSDAESINGTGEPEETERVTPAEPETLPWEERPALPAEVSQGSPARAWQRFLTIAAVASLSVVLVAFGIWELSNHVAERGSPSVGQDQEVLDTAETVPMPGSDVPEAPPVALSTVDASRRAEILTAQAELDELRARLSSLSTQLTDFGSQKTELLSSELGKRVAADSMAVEMFVSLANRERLTPREVESMQRVVMALAQPVEAAVTDEQSTLEIDAKFKSQVADLQKQVDSELRSLETDRRQLQVLTRDAAAREPASLTLAEAIEAHEEDLLREQNERIAAEVKKQRDTLVAEEAAAQAAIEKLESEKRIAEAELKRQEKEAELAGLEVEKRRFADEIEAAKQRAELERRFEKDLADIKSTLVPFTSAGNWQIVNGKWAYQNEKSPISLSGLKATGALNGDALGYQTLLSVASGPGRNDRPSGSFRPGTGGLARPEDMPLLSKARDYLNIYGEVLVDREMLAP